jgi:thiamine biosynthesis lipoprotein
MDKLVLIPGQCAVSTVVAGVHVDLSSVAKGLAADAAAKALKANGFNNFLVNAGGEIRTSSDGSKRWHVGIQVPKEDAPANEVFADRVLEMENGAVATSGSYRQYVRRGTNTYSHIVDPRTGRPLRTATVSVTVRAAECAVADAWATALYTLPAEDAVALAAGTEGIECLIIERPAEGSEMYRFRATEEFGGF